MSLAPESSAPRSTPGRVTHRRVCGIQQSPATLVNQLRHMLAHGGYKLGFSIVKELVQNADDAKARTLWIGRSEGLRSAPHPLLRGPAMFAINDGPLTSSDVEAIRSFGLTNKGSDANKVGRFGLGLKSVFHLCEGFFLVASHEPETGVAGPVETGPWGMLVNPWRGESGDPMHPEWDIVQDEDLDAVAGAARAAIRSEGRHEPGHWVCFWLPLRTAGDDRERSIVAQYPLQDGAIDQVLGETTPAQVARLLPLLAHIDRVELTLTRGRSTIDLAQGSTRRIALTKDPAVRRRVLRGVVKWTSPRATGGVEEVRYVGLEQELSDTELLQLTTDPAWPRAFTYDDHLRPQDEPEKAHAHGAAVLLWNTRADAGRLHVAKAVFLPLGGEPLGDLAWDAQCDAQLLLHGYLFCNERRDSADVEPTNDPAANLRRRWNVRLFARATLGSVVPMLEELAKDSGAPLVSELTRSLAQILVGPLEWARTAVCADSQWIRRLGADGSARWEAVGARDMIVELPIGPNGESPPMSGLPGLARVCAARAVTVRGWPRLSSRQQTGSWSEADLVMVLDGATADPAALPWIVSLFEDVRVVERLSLGRSSSLAAAWVGFVRATLLAWAGMPGRSGDEQTLRRLIATLPATLRVRLNHGSSSGPLVPGRFAALLTDTTLSRVPVPARLAPAEGPEPPLGHEDADRLLCALASDPDPVRETSELAEQVVRACGDAKLSDQAQQLTIFAGRAVGTRSWHLRSLADLRAAAGRGLVVGEGDRDDLAPALGHALAEGPVVLVSRAVASWVGAQPATPDGIRRFLAVARPPLAPADRRVSLLRMLATDDGTLKLDDEQRRGLRFLLHGRAEDDATTSLLSGGTADGSVWAKLAERALASLRESWRWLTQEVIAVLTPEAQAILNVRAVDGQSVARLLERTAVEQLSLEDLTADECERIVAEWRGDPKVLGRLPIHALAGLGGGRVAVDADVRLEGNFDPTTGDPPHLPIRLIRRSPDAVVALQQRTFATELDPSEAIRFACGVTDPHRYWRTIVRAVGALSTARIQGKLPTEARETRWIPLRSGGGVRHRDLVHIGGVDDLLARVLPISGSATGGPIPIGHLEPEVREALLSEQVVRYLALHSPDLEALGRALARLPGWQIGDASALGIIDTEPPSELLAEWLEVFSRADPEVQPAYELLRAVGNSNQAHAARLFAHLAGRIDVDRLDTVLRAIQTEHDRMGRDRRPVALAWFARYLRVASQQGEIAVLLGLDLPLPSQDGTWRTPDQLCHPDMGDDHHDVAPGYLLGEGLDAIVPRSPVTTVLSALGSKTQDDREIDDNELRDSASRLGALLARWQGTVPDVCLGAFVALLGDDPEMLKLAGHYLGNRTVEGVRAQVGWTEVKGGLVGMDESITVTMAKQRFAIEVKDVDRLTLPNLRGAPTSFPVRKTPKTLIVSRTRCQGTPTHRLNRLVLRPLNPETYPDQEARLALLHATAQQIMSEIYNRPRNSLEALFSDLRQTGQIDIEVARELILSSAHDTFRLTRNVADAPELQALLRDLDAAIAREAEARRDRNAANRQLAAKLIEEHRQTLRERLANPDDPWARALLETARQRIQDYQYRAYAIPFEILQNADDAGVELEGIWRDLGMASPTLDGRRFVVVVDPKRLVFIHWGRPINRYMLKGWDRGRELGYDRDLKKMLSFAASDKALGDCRRNGRFGLGFKSTLLASSRPTVLSEETHFAVSGGRFPIPLRPEEVVRLREELARHSSQGAASNQGTIIELPLDERGGGSAVLERFRELGALVVLFTLHIDSIEIVDATGPNSAPISFARKGKPVPGVDGLERTTVLVNHGAVAQEVLVFRSAVGVVVFGVGADGFQALPPEIPTFWAMAPTDQRLQAGFLLHAKFDLDPGRTQLASDSALNGELMVQLGQAFGRALAQLHGRTMTDWRACRDALGLRATITADDLWESLWSRLAPAGTGLLEPFVWGVKGPVPAAIPTLGAGRPIVPTQLEGHGRFTNSQAIRYAASGLISRRDVAALVAAWPGFRGVHPTGSVIASAVAEKMPPVGRAALGVPRQLSRLVVKDVVACELGEDLSCTPEVARRLAALVGGNGMVRWHESDSEDRWQDFLGDVMFLGADARWTTAERLLASGTESELFGFAPPSRQLSSAYDAVGQEFFQSCRRARRPERPDSQEVTRWFTAASSETARTAALRFLAQGDWNLRQAVIGILRDRAPGPNDWWRTDAAHLLIDEVGGPATDVSIIRAMLAVTAGPATPKAAPVPMPADARRCLEAIVEWWADAQAEHVARYEQRLYRGRLPTIDPSGDLRETGLRREWMRLLLLGGLHRLGRTRPEHHGAYLDLCERRQWLSMFATPHPNRDAWARLMEEYLDGSASGDLTYFQWVSQLLTTFQLSRWLEAYAQGFLLLAESDAPTFQFVLTQRNFPGLQFTELDAPSAMRALSLGANFVIRELLRLGVVRDRAAVHPLCFVPRRAVRGLIASLGGPTTERRDAPYEVISRRIHAFLVEHLGPELATFGGCFDLPLGIVAESADLREQLFSGQIRYDPSEAGELDEEDL